MSKFLSEEWLEAAAAIREEFKGQGGAPPHKMKMNLVITGAPEDVSAGSIDAHMDTTDGDMHMDVGHLEGPDLTVTFIGDKRVLADVDALARHGYGEDAFGNNVLLPRELSYLRR